MAVYLVTISEHRRFVLSIEAHDAWEARELAEEHLDAGRLTPEDTDVEVDIEGDEDS